MDRQGRGLFIIGIVLSGIVCGRNTIAQTYPELSAGKQAAVARASAPLPTTTRNPEETRALYRSMLAEFAWRPIGPSATGGRVVDIAVDPQRRSTLYVASASGGLWKSVNNGTTWDCIFQYEGTISIGDVCVDPQVPDTLWVGTGESNNQRSSYWGDGVYKSTDGGKSWRNVGLKRTGHIGRIVVDPRDSATVYVAALGHLYSHNAERGLYKTSDGGDTWQHVLDLGSAVGVADVVIDPMSSSHLLVASYERLRRAWNFDGAGPGSAIYRSTDAGESWTRVTSGLPSGEIGRIGLAFAASQPKTVYASVSNQNVAPVGAAARGEDVADDYGLLLEAEDGGARVVRIERGSAAARAGFKIDDLIVQLAGVELDSSAAAAHAIAGLRGGDNTEAVVSRDDKRTTRTMRLPRATARTVGGEIYRSQDGGVTWQKRNERSVGGSPAYYYGQIRVDPNDSDCVYVLGVPLSRSEDGGVTWSSNVARSVHVDHHAFWIDPTDSDHLLLGNDGGFHVSWDRGATWDHVFNLPLSQFYAIAVDMQQPYHVYGGLQDNGSYGGPSRSRKRGGVGRFDWYRVGGGDGFYVQVDPNDADVVFSESQFGGISRLDKSTGERRSIRPPQSDRGGDPDRYNWNSPILMSKHDPRTIYFCGNKVFKSYNRGDDWLTISPDLTTHDATKVAGNVPHCTITTIDESRRDENLLIVGTDDGNVQLTSDGGKSWREISGSLPMRPANWWVSRVRLSDHVRERAYVTFTGYREDDFRPFVFVTDDLGKSWWSLARGLPLEGPVNVISEDPRNADVLYVGTDFGAFASFDRGAHWHALAAGLPTIPVHDLVIHPREHEIVIGTHGRGMFILDASPLAELTEATLDEPCQLFDVKDAVRWRSMGGTSISGDRKRIAPNPEGGAAIHYYLRDANDDLELVVRDADGHRVRSLQASREAGLHRVLWDLRAEARGQDASRSTRRRGRRRFGRGGAFVEPGHYEVVLKVGDTERKQGFDVLADPIEVVKP